MGPSRRARQPPRARVITVTEAPNARILVAIEGHLIAHQALQLGAEIAALWRSELVALCVAAQEPPQLPALPFAIEIDRVSAARREFDASRLLAASRIWRRQIDDQLARLATAHRISATSTIVPGRLWRDLLPVAGAEDLLLVTGSAAFARHPIARRQRRPIAAVLFGTDRDARVLAVASSLSRAFHVDTVAFAIAAERDAAERIAATLATAPQAIPRLPGGDDDARGMVQTFEELGCRWLVASRTDVTAAGFDLQPFLMRPSGTALLVP